MTKQSKQQERSCHFAEECIIARADQCEMDSRASDCVFYKQYFWDKIQEIRRITKCNNPK